jgi:predicted RNase H-like HicB family nuclease
MADGSTYKEAVDNAEVEIQEWIETTKKLGRPIKDSWKVEQAMRYIRVQAGR